jgi:hypothetical protein
MYQDIAQFRASFMSLGVASRSFRSRVPWMDFFPVLSFFRLSFHLESRYQVFILG